MKYRRQNLHAGYSNEPCHRNRNNNQYIEPSLPRLLLSTNLDIQSDGNQKDNHGDLQQSATTTHRSRTDPQTHKKHDQANEYDLPTTHIHLTPSQRALLPPEPTSPEQDDHRGRSIAHRRERHPGYVEAKRGFRIQDVLETEQLSDDYAEHGKGQGCS